MKSKLCKVISNVFGFRKIRNKKIQKLLGEYEFSVFSNNCIGGVFLHDAAKRFNSPLVNLRVGGVISCRF